MNIRFPQRLASTAASIASALILAAAACPATALTHEPPPDAAPGPDVTLDKKTLEVIQEATFEVVVRKPEADSLTYERPLPLNLLPYHMRHDKYYSVGTAFAIGPDQFVSAVHVLNLGTESQFTDISLRDKSGAVYPIDRILRYSSRRDFATFTIRGPSVKQYFQPNIHPELNEKVYAVGNAYGEGIVIRDGLYTSNTPEERDGAWNWIRFSAAASPGNSGGPLLDREGRLIGIVQAKSEAENLNYALPIGEVLDAKDGVGVLDMQMLYRIENMPIRKAALLVRNIELPKSYDALNRELIQLIDHAGSELMDDAFREGRANIFPNSPGAAKLLHDSAYITIFPGLIAMGDDGIWSVYKPSKINKADLGANGFLTWGDLGESTWFHLHLPDSVALPDAVADSRVMMDLFLKGANYSRKIGAEHVKIVSMGAAQAETAHVDSYGRKWKVMTWPIEFEDQQLAMVVLPTPDGFVGVAKTMDTGQLQNNLRDMKALTDFTYFSYYATLGRWKTFLGMKDLLPAAFAGIEIEFAPGKEFHYHSRRVDFSYPASLMKISDNSDLQLGFSFFADGGKVVWDVSRVMAGENKNSKDSYVVVRETRPAQNMSDDDAKYWDSLTNRKHPFDRVSYFDNDQTIIGMVFPDKTGAPPLATAQVLYAVLHFSDGVVQAATASSQLDRFVHGLSVHESLYSADGHGEVAAKEQD